MPPLTVADFLSQIDELLTPDQLRELNEPTMIVDRNPDSLRDYVMRENWLTQYQMESLFSNRGHLLKIGNYLIQEPLPNSLGKKSFRAKVKDQDQFVVLHQLTDEWMPQYESTEEYIARASLAKGLKHPHILALLEIVVEPLEDGKKEIYLVEEYVDGIDLGYLVREMGSLPAGLACHYIAQVAIALESAHQSGVYHGALTPESLILTPISRKYRSETTEMNNTPILRPTASSIVRVSGIGQLPLQFTRLNPQENSFQFPLALSYLPPEIAIGSLPSAQRDLYSFGCCFYYLLSGKPPIPDETIREAVLTQKPALPGALPIQQIRPDVPLELVTLIHQLLHSDPLQRETSIQNVLRVLAKFCNIPSLAVDSKNSPSGLDPKANTPTESMPENGTFSDSPSTDQTSHYTLGNHAVAQRIDENQEPVPEHEQKIAVAVPIIEEFEETNFNIPTEQIPDFGFENQDPFAQEAEVFANDPYGGDSAPSQKNKKVQESQRWKLWAILGLCFHGTAVTLGVGYFLGWFDPKKPDPTPDTTPPAKKAPRKTKN